MYISDVSSVDLKPGHILLGGAEILAVSPTGTAKVRVTYRWPDAEAIVCEWSAKATHSVLFDYSE